MSTTYVVAYRTHMHRVMISNPECHFVLFYAATELFYKKEMLYQSYVFYENL
jgi:hypothetical protein